MNYHRIIIQSLIHVYDSYVYAQEREKLNLSMVMPAEFPKH